MQLSPEQVGSGGSASQLMADESIFSMTDSCAIRDDFTATAKISESVVLVLLIVLT